MSEDKTNMEEWMYDFACKQRDITQEANDRIDSKAMNLISFAGVLIPIISGVLFFGIDKTLILKEILSIYIVAIFLLLISIIFAFLTVWVRNQGFLNINEHFNKCPENIKEIYGLTARRIGNWQKQIVKIGRYKSIYFFISSVAFIVALLLIIYVAYLVSSL